MGTEMGEERGVEAEEVEKGVGGMDMPRMEMRKAMELPASRSTPTKKQRSGVAGRGQAGAVREWLASRGTVKTLPLKGAVLVWHGWCCKHARAVARGLRCPTEAMPTEGYACSKIVQWEVPGLLSYDDA